MNSTPNANGDHSNFIKISDIATSTYPRASNIYQDGSRDNGISPRDFFELPRHDYHTISKIISELATFRGRDFNLRQLELSSEIELSILLANLGFLRSMKIVPETGRNIDPEALLLSTSIRLGDKEEISCQWRRFTLKSKTLTDLVEWISAQGKVRLSRLIFQLIGMAGRRVSRDNIRGARTAIETLLISRLVAKENSYIMASGVISSSSKPVFNQVGLKAISEVGSINIHLHFGSGELPEEASNLLRAISLKL